MSIEQQKSEENQPVSREDFIQFLLSKIGEVKSEYNTAKGKLGIDPNDALARNIMNKTGNIGRTVTDDPETARMLYRWRLSLDQGISEEEKRASLAEILEEVGLSEEAARQ